MLFSRTSLMLAFTTLVAAAPYNPETKRWWHPSSSNSASSGSSVDFYGSRRDHSWHGRGTYQQEAGQCNVNSVSMPQAPKPLPEPSEGLTLYHVAVGRGTQNYTCDLSNSTAVPVAAGALASLFNVTCLSADSPNLLSSLPNIALALPIPSSTSNSSPAVQDLSGHHYFTDATTAYFNLDTTLVEYGRGGFKKINATDAPADAMVGQNGKGYGAVSWLKLTSKESPEDCSFREVYRVNTAGGQPPKTCTGQQAEFEVEYAAEYWFYS